MRGIKGPQKLQIKLAPDVYRSLLGENSMISARGPNHIVFLAEGKGGIVSTTAPVVPDVPQPEGIASGRNLLHISQRHP
jgi:hypothetical protein